LNFFEEVKQSDSKKKKKKKIKKRFSYLKIEKNMASINKNKKIFGNV